MPSTPLPTHLRPTQDRYFATAETLLSGPTKRALILPEVTEEILRIGLRRSPKEACGVITPDERVWEVANRSPEPTQNYILERDDVLTTLKTWGETWPGDPGDVLLVIWHTHPNGLIGPSRDDLINKRIHALDTGFELPHLVVSLPNGEAVQF